MSSGPEMTERISNRVFHTLAILFTISWAGILLAWALLTPAFRSPDGPAHFNSVLRVAHGGGWPEPGTVEIDDSLLLAGQEAGLIPENRDSLGMLGITVLNGGTIQGTGPGFWQVEPTEHYSVLDYGQVEVPGFDDQDQMTQHPGLYYYLAAGVLHLVGAMDWTWNGQYLLIVLFSSTLMVPVVPLTLLTARLTGLSRLASLATALPIFALPQLAHIGASVSNDSLTILASSATMAGSAYLMRRGFTWKATLATGIPFGVATLTKGTALPLVFTIILAGILVAKYSDQKGNAGTLISFFAGMVPIGLVTISMGGWWWIANLVNHGVIQPIGFKSQLYEWRDVTPTLGEWIDGASFRLLSSTWGGFGWLEVHYSTVVWWGATIVAIILICSGIGGAVRMHPVSRVPAWLMLSALLTSVFFALAINLRLSWDSYVEFGTIAGIQGRYLFIAVVPLAVIFGWACEWVIQRTKRWVRTTLIAVSILSAGTMACSGWRMFAIAVYPNFAGPIPIDFTRWMLWSLLPGRVVVGSTMIAAVFAVGSAVAYLVTVARSSSVSVAEGAIEPDGEIEQVTNPSVP